MVRVFYEPPPGGPRTDLMRGGYYAESSKTPMFLRKLSKAKPITVILPVVSFIGAMCYIPFRKYRCWTSK